MWYSFQVISTWHFIENNNNKTYFHYCTNNTMLLHLVEDQLWWPDHRVQSDVWDVQVPADRHRHHRPVRLNQGHSPGPHSWAVRAWVSLRKTTETWYEHVQLCRKSVSLCFPLWCDFHACSTEFRRDTDMTHCKSCLVNWFNWDLRGGYGWVSVVNMSHFLLNLLTFPFEIQTYSPCV